MLASPRRRACARCPHPDARRPNGSFGGPAACVRAGAEKEEGRWFRERRAAPGKFASLKKKHAAGVGSRAHGGCPATVGHLYGFGSTEEEYTLLVRGTSQRGRRAEGPFKHSTGKGYVEAKPGQYAGRQRGSLLVPFIVEASRAQGVRSAACSRAVLKQRARATAPLTVARATARANSTYTTRV